MIIEEKFARLRTYRNNINRYHWLLKTELSALERQFIERRLNEEESAMESWPHRPLLSRSKSQNPLRSRQLSRGNGATTRRRSIVMAGRTQVGKKHFMKTVHDELAKFEQKEIEFQKTERNQRAARLRLPIGKHYPPLSKSATDGGAGTFRS